MKAKNKIAGEDALTGKQAETMLISKGYDQKRLSRLAAPSKVAFYKREILGHTPEMFTEQEFHDLYDVHGVNFSGKNDRTDALVTRDALMKGMTGGWTAPTQGLNATNFKYESHYGPGTMLVLVPKYYVENYSTDKPAKVMNGYMPRSPEIAIVEEADYVDFSRDDFGNPKPYGVDYKKLFNIGTNIPDLEATQETTAMADEPQRPEAAIKQLKDLIRLFVENCTADTTPQICRVSQSTEGYIMIEESIIKKCIATGMPVGSAMAELDNELERAYE